MPILFNLNYRFNAVPFKIPATYFVDVDKMILKFMQRGRRPSITRILKEKNKIRLTLPDIKTYCKAYSNQDCDTGKRVNK